MIAKWRSPWWPKKLLFRKFIALVYQWFWVSNSRRLTWLLFYFKQQLLFYKNMYMDGQQSPVVPYPEQSRFSFSGPPLFTTTCHIFFGNGTKQVLPQKEKLGGVKLTWEMANRKTSILQWTPTNQSIWWFLTSTVTKRMKEEEKVL